MTCRPALACLVLLVISCGGEQQAAPRAASLQSAPSPGPAAAPDAGVAAAPAVAPSDACGDGAPPTLDCRCAAGDTEACLRSSDAAFRRGEHDAAILRVYALCQKGAPEACFRAEKYLTKLGIRARLGTSPTELRARGVRLLEEGCKAGEASACFGYGKLLVEGKHVTADLVRGQQQLEAACDGGHAPACSFLAGRHESGAGGLEKDEGRALLLREKACEAGHAASCTELGDRLARADAARASALFERACAGNDGVGCARSATLHARRGEGRRALARFLKACELEHAASCADAGALLEAGTGTAPDPAKARSLYQAACEDEVGVGCASLASLVARGIGGERNWGDAVALYAKACSLEVEKACTEGARLKRNAPDWRCRTEAECEARCSEKLARACRELGDLRAAESDSCLGAEEAYEMACEHGDGTGCLRVQEYERACQAGELDGCVKAHALEYEGAQPASQRTIARALQTMCTRRKHTSACIQLATLDATPEARSRKLLRRACDQGHGSACRLLAGPLGFGATSSQALERSEPERRQAEKAFRERERLLRKACDLGDVTACAWGDEAGKARARELREAQRCGRGGIDF